MMSKKRRKPGRPAREAGALSAICEVGKRYKRTGKLGCTGDEFRAIGDGLNLADDPQEATTRREQREAYRWVYGQVGGNTEMLDVIQRGA